MRRFIAESCAVARKERFSSFLTSLAATVGLAIGIGNVWRFPYMMGSYGGAAFLLLFVACIIFLSLPALMAEWALARQTRAGTIGAFKATFGPVPGRIVGYGLLGCLTVAGGYYLAVIANVFFSAWFSVATGFNTEAIPEFQAGLASVPIQYGLGLAILLMTAVVIQRGIRSGIQLLSTIFVPFFFIASFYLVFKTLTMPGAIGHLAEFMKPDFSKIRFTHVFAAMGQAYFSIGLGATLTLIYGSYLRDDIRLPRMAALTCASDTVAALLAALYLIPALLVFGMDLTSGPTLLFETLPNLLKELPGGRLFGSLMLTSLALVTFLSYVAVVEAVLGGLGDDQENIPFSKGQLLTGICIIQAVLLLLFIVRPGTIAVADLIFGSAGLMFGGGLGLLALTWGIGKKKTLYQVFGRDTGWLPALYFFWIKWVAPAILLVVLAGTLFEAFT